MKFKILHPIVEEVGMKKGMGVEETILWQHLEALTVYDMPDMTEATACWKLRKVLKRQIPI